MTLSDKIYKGSVIFVKDVRGFISDLKEEIKKFYYGKSMGDSDIRDYTSQIIDKLAGSELIHEETYNEVASDVLERELIKSEDKPLIKTRAWKKGEFEEWKKKNFKPLKSKLSKKEVSEIARKTLEETGYLKKGCGKSFYKKTTRLSYFCGEEEICPACSLRPTRSGDGE